MDVNLKRFEILKRLNRLEDECQSCPNKPPSDRYITSPICKVCDVLSDMKQVGIELDELIKRPEPERVASAPRKRKARKHYKPFWTNAELKLLSSLKGNPPDVYTQFACVYPERTKNAVVRKHYELMRKGEVVE